MGRFQKIRTIFKNRWMVVAGMLFMLSWVFPGAVRAVPLTTLTANADTIVMAVPVQKTCYWENKVIKTRARLRVERVLAGQVSSREITVVYDGGVVGKIGLRVSHGVRLPKGQKGILFLVEGMTGYQVLDDMDGVFFVVTSPEGEVVVPEALLTTRPGTLIKSLRETAGNNQGVPLQAFIQHIRALRGNRP